MSTFHVIEEERGTWTGTRHAHNGYYAGNFGTGSAASFPAAVVVLRTAAHPSERRCA